MATAGIGKAAALTNPRHREKGEKQTELDIRKLIPAISNIRDFSSCQPASY
jgi:hypothetical protein